MLKMRLWKRVVLMAQSGLGVAGAVMFALGALGCRPLAALNRWVTRAEGGFRPGALAVLLILAASLAALGALSFAIALCAGKTRGARLLTLRSEGGDEILLTQETLDQLARSAVGEPEGISEIRVAAGYSDRMAAVTVEVAVSPAINIPESIRAIQSRVRGQLEGMSGIPVSSVDVKVVSLRLEGANENALCQTEKASETENKTDTDQNTHE